MFGVGSAGIRLLAVVGLGTTVKLLSLGLEVKGGIVVGGEGVYMGEIGLGIQVGGYREFDSLNVTWLFLPAG